MDFNPLLNASLAVQIHVATVVAAFFLGAWQILLSTKGSSPHRKLGSFYIGLMLVTAVAAFFIRAPSVPGMPSFYGYKLHRATMMGLFVSGIGIAGALAFTPGRVMHAIVFGE